MEERLDALEAKVGRVGTRLGVKIDDWTQLTYMSIQAAGGICEEGWKLQWQGLIEGGMVLGC